MADTVKSIILPNHTYASNELNLFDVMTCIPCLIFPPINVILGIFMIPMVVLFEVKHFHNNFCIIHFNIIIGYLCFTIPGFFVYCLKVYEMRVIPIKFYGIYNQCLIMSNFGLDLLRCLWLTVFIERTFATIYYGVYERRRFLLVSIILVTASYVVTIVINYMRFNSNGPLSYFYVVYSVMSIIDISGALSIHILSKYIRKIRKINARSDIKLIQRYQLAENIRVIKLMLPILASGSCLTLFGTCIIWLSLTDFFFNWFHYTTNIFLDTFNIYICIALIVCIRHDILNDSSLSSIYYKIIHRKKHIRTAPMLKNTEGQRMELKETIDVHFTNLNKMWL